MNAIERFLDRITINDNGCWVWNGYLTNGYGKFQDKRKRYRAHRWSYEVFIADIPEGLTIDHLCRNRACVNPSHLEAVTIKENVLRGEGPTAINARKDRCGICGGEYDYVTNGGKNRRCRSCCRKRWKRVYQERKNG